MRISLAAAIAVFALPLAARADLLGDSVHVTFNYPNAGTVYEDDGTTLVPGSVGALGQFTLAVSATQITVEDLSSTGFLSAPFNGFVFTDLTKDPMITGATEDGASTLTGGLATLVPNGVALNFADLPAGPGESAIFDLQFGSSAASVTPEPSAIALLGTGLLGVAGAVRRRSPDL